MKKQHDIKLTFLGTGTSSGVPALRCHCPVCRSSDPRDKRLRCSALLSIDGRNMLIDCGPDFHRQMLRLDSPDLRALLVTHSHYDHVGGIDDLRPYCYPDGFDIYCQADVDADLRMRTPYCYAEHPYPGAPILHNHVITPYIPFYIDGIEILPLAVNHYLKSILGFRIGHFAYITDAKIIPVDTLEAIRGVDTLVVNALRQKPHIAHMNLTEALDVINTVRPRIAYLTHFSHEIGLHEKVQQTLPKNVKLAYDGLTIDVKPNNSTK